MAGAGSFFFSSLGPARLRRLRRLLLLLSPILPLSLLQLPSLPFTPSSSEVHSPSSSFSFSSSLSFPLSLLSSQLPHRHLHQLRDQTKDSSLSAPLPQWLRSSPTHAAAPAGPAALPSAGQVELPESPIHPPPPPIPAQETSSCWEVEGGWVGFSSGF